MKAADALIVASPEYNASMPGAIKNLIDWGYHIRPQPFNGKQALLMSASPSMVGGNRGLWALRVAVRASRDARVPGHVLARPGPSGMERRHAQGTRAGLQRAVGSARSGCFLDLVEATKHYPRIKKVWVEFLGEHPDAQIDRVETAPAA